MSGQEAAGEPGLNAAAIVTALNRHQVRYVVTVASVMVAAACPAKRQARGGKDRPVHAEREQPGRRAVDFQLSGTSSATSW